MWATGSNKYGQFGDGTTSSSGSFVQITHGFDESTRVQMPASAHLERVQTPSPARFVRGMRSSGCARCGTRKKSGQRSCCARGGAWFKKCGDLGDSKFDHTWYEGIWACKSRGNFAANMAQQLVAARQNSHGCIHCNHDRCSSQTTTGPHKTILLRHFQFQRWVWKSNFRTTALKSTLFSRRSQLHIRSQTSWRFRTQLQKRSLFLVLFRQCNQSQI